MRLIARAALLLCFVVASSLATAQETTTPPSTCSEALVRDTASAVWTGIQAQYLKLADAMRKRDVDALFALYVPDFHAVTPTGERWSRERSLAYQRNGLAQVRETHQITNTIVRLTTCDDHATATVLQQWYRTQMMEGQLRRVETNAVQDESWTRTADGWKRGNIFNVRNGLAFVDGKRVNTNRPYDSEAPAFDPNDPHPKRPLADTLLQLVNVHGIGPALQAYRALRQSPDFYMTENQLNALGYRLMELKRVNEAIELFKLNVEAYPRSANAYDSLGEAYMTGGERDQAIKSYRRSLDLNPQNANAREKLRVLERH
jgi:tetratricopeptide (TPR) repeat protein